MKKAWYNVLFVSGDEWTVEATAPCPPPGDATTWLVTRMETSNMKPNGRYTIHADNVCAWGLAGLQPEDTP